MSEIIRKADIKDSLSIQNVLHSAHKQNYKRGFLFPAFTVSRGKLRLKMKRDRYYVSMLNGVMIGTVAIKRRSKNWEIGSLAVVPKYQKLGIGHRLLQYGEKKIRELGGKKVSLFTPKDHPSLPLYYKKKGYRAIKVTYFRNMKWIQLQKKLK